MRIPDHLTCLLKNLLLPDLHTDFSRGRSGSNSWNWTWNNRLVPNRKMSTSRLYIVTLLFKLYMCRSAGLECLTVTGTRAGEPWTWNIVPDNGCYYHVDLLRSSSGGQFRKMTDSQMTYYVWDYSAYPECIGQEAEPAQETTEVPTEN